MPSPPHTPSVAGPSSQQYGHTVYGGPSQTSTGTAEQTLANLATMAQTMTSTCVRLLQAQAEDNKLRMEYLRRREEREDVESCMRREAEKRRQEREVVEGERLQQMATMKSKWDLATELLSNPSVEASVRQVAGEFLKKLFTND